VTGTPLIDCLIFDVDDTLYSTTEFSIVARRNSVRAMIRAGLQAGEEEAFQELMEVVSEFSSNYPHHFGRLLDRFGPASYAGHNPSVIIAAGIVGYHRTKEEGMRLLPDVRTVLEFLKDAGVRMGIISAGIATKQAEKLIRLDALQYFDPTSMFFTDQMGVSKPNPKLYQKAVDAMGVQPSRALYVGDRPSNDIVPANSVGLRTVLYGGAEGKYYRDGGCDVADHRLHDLTDLIPILRQTYHLAI